MNVIGIGGRKKAGKNTAADLFSKHGFKELSFAYHLKKACSEAFDISYDTFHSQSSKEVPFKEPIVVTMDNIDRLVKYLRGVGTIEPHHVVKLYHKAYSKPMFTPRNILQFVGTELIRECVSDTFWCDVLKSDIQKYGKVVIPDMRLPNEREFLRSLGASLLLIKRATSESTDGHSSENSLGDDSDYDVVFDNNETIEDLHNTLDGWYDTSTTCEKARA